MPGSEDTSPSEERLTREAARIYLRLRQFPDDAETCMERDAFLARGAAERDVYARMDRAANAARRRMVSTRNRRYGIALLGALLASLYLAVTPAKVILLADHRSGTDSQSVALPSGDEMVLDAGSAISDRSSATERRIALLRGAAFFKVISEDRAFVVETGEFEVRVTGTSFDVATTDEAAMVTVAEGSVQVRTALQTWTLAPGDRLLMPQSGDARIVPVDASDAIGWRDAEMLTTGMTFGQVAEVLDRRIPGEVIVLGDSLAKIEISGIVDISDPRAALRNLAATGDARVLSLPLLTLVLH